jgi:hypothetical protein
MSKMDKISINCQSISSDLQYPIPSEKHLNFVFNFCSNVLRRLGDFGFYYLEVIKADVYSSFNHTEAYITAIFVSPLDGKKIEKNISFYLPPIEQLSTKESELFLQKGIELINACKDKFKLILRDLRQKADNLEKEMDSVLVLNEEQILYILEQDKKLYKILSAASKLCFSWNIGAGAIRNRIWNYLSKKQDDSKNDIDFIYFDKNYVYDEKEIEKILNDCFPANWSIKNQAKMHLVNGDRPYQNMEDAMSYWPETCTAIGVTLENRKLKLTAPYGITDLVNFIVRPIPIWKHLKKGLPLKNGKKNGHKLKLLCNIQTEFNSVFLLFIKEFFRLYTKLFDNIFYYFLTNFTLMRIWNSNWFSFH